MYRISTSHPIGNRQFATLRYALRMARQWGFPLYLMRPVRRVRLTVVGK